MYKYVLNIVFDMMNVIIFYDVIINCYKVLGVLMLYNIKIYGCVYLFYYLVIYLVRSLVDGNIFVIGSYFCIIFGFFELGVI